MSDRKQEVEARISAIEAELGRPNQLRRELEELRNELKQLNKPNLGIEFVCMGAAYDDGGRQKYTTVVVREDGSVLKIPPNHQFHGNEVDQHEAGISQQEFVTATEQDRVYYGGRLAVVNKERAKQLIAGGCHVIRREARPDVVFGPEIHHPAQV